MEVRLPDADTLVPIERFKERLALGLGKVEHAARVRIVHEPAVRRPAADDDLLIAGLQRLLLDLSYPRIAEGRALIRRPLADGELRGRLGGLLDHLDAGRAGSDAQIGTAMGEGRGCLKV